MASNGLFLYYLLSRTISDTCFFELSLVDLDDLSFLPSFLP